MLAQPFLTRDALARVLRSLLEAEWRMLRGKAAAAKVQTAAVNDMLLSSPEAWGCDSLDLLRLCAAANEMFHLHKAGVEQDLLSAPTFGAWLDVIQRSWGSGDAEVTFSTSGSTGPAKRCTHMQAFLAVEVEALANRFRDRRRIVALAPAHHIYGFLFTALMPDALDVPCIEAERFNIAALRATLQPGDLLVSFPERWAYLACSLPDWPEQVEGVVSTAPCPAETLDRLAERGLARMTEVYGSSETAGIAWRAAPGASYDLMPHWQFLEPQDAEAACLVHRDGSHHKLMDRVTRIGDRGFSLGGRRDGMVQVGGINVSPSAVAGRLCERPGVRWAVVRLMRPAEGDRLKALIGIGPDCDASATLTKLEAWAALHLATAERPTVFTLSALEAQPAKTFDW
ncbi:AMP-binding protein [Lichenihabitans sp. Uapishka_5]|uniref:AMP-binding protein n=1 Tax=Lichenihabitans sp. Uapishka_5 TaxID=3037302 RepID=UPI0029E7F447|nr:AMP-binding protein [Lichenihabitans sp. Uapishka_5]MDX7950271.1 AMP-binding protein [Lichenihabitans sp. Uapishka_5]